MQAVIINRMYAGEYLTKDIGGGETINLLCADNGVNYCFINPYGLFNPAYDDQVTAVVHTRLYEAGCFEVIGVSLLDKDSQLIHPKGFSFKERCRNAADTLRTYMRTTPILYGGVPYMKDSDEYPAYTFASARLLLPKKQIFLLDSHYPKEIGDSVISYRLADKRFAKQALHMFVDDTQNPLSFDRIMQMIHDDRSWQEKIIKIDDVHHDNHFNFLTLIGKEDDELSFSNMFRYFFANHPDLLIGFAEEILKIHLGKNPVIKREFHNIDLWIEDDESIVVIENKVKSGINGVSPRHDFGDGGLVQSQLLKYHNFAVDYAGDGKKAFFFLFVPNYNHLDLSAYEGSRFYKVIRYRDIYRYLISKNADSPYYRDFCNALYKHTKDIPVDYSEKLLNYLQKQIKKEKERNHG